MQYRIILYNVLTGLDCFSLYLMDHFEKTNLTKPNTPVAYPTKHHSEQKCAHFCSVWCIVGYRTSAFWELWICSTRASYIFEAPMTIGTLSLRSNSWRPSGTCIIRSENSLSPVRRQVIFWTNAGLLSIGSLGTFSTKYNHFHTRNFFFFFYFFFYFFFILFFFFSTQETDFY